MVVGRIFLQMLSEAVHSGSFLSYFLWCCLQKVVFFDCPKHIVFDVDFSTKIDLALPDFTLLCLILFCYTSSLFVPGLFEQQFCKKLFQTSLLDPD
jgi:hypothetical protein